MDDAFRACRIDVIDLDSWDSPRENKRIRNCGGMRDYKRVENTIAVYMYMYYIINVYRESLKKVDGMLSMLWSWRRGAKD